MDKNVVIAESDTADENQELTGFSEEFKAYIVGRLNTLDKKRPDTLKERGLEPNNIYVYDQVRKDGKGLKKITSITDLKTKCPDISDLSGVDKLENLKGINISSANLVNLDFSKNKNLEGISAFSCTNLETLKLYTGEGSKLNSINLTKTKVKSLDLSNCTALKRIYITNNKEMTELKLG